MFVWKNITPFSCEYPSMLISVTFDVDIFYSFSLKFVISLLEIKLLNNLTNNFYISNNIITKVSLSYCGRPINVNYRLLGNDIL